MSCLRSKAETSCARAVWKTNGGNIERKKNSVHKKKKTNIYDVDEKNKKKKVIFFWLILKKGYIYIYIHMIWTPHEENKEF
jgi:hypothetical protein